MLQGRDCGFGGRETQAATNFRKLGLRESRTKALAIAEELYQK